MSSSMKVLVATDGSEPAARATEFMISMLGKMSCDVNVLVVLSYSLYPYGEGDEPAEREEHLRAVTEAVDAVSKQVVRSIEDAGHKVRVARRFGYPADEIVNEIKEWEPDLIVMGRRTFAALLDGWEASPNTFSITRTCRSCSCPNSRPKVEAALGG